MAKVGRPKKPPTTKKLLKEILPIEDIFDEKEGAMYTDLVSVYLSDFDAEDLSSSDMDDILDLAKNRVLEFRLLKESKGDADVQMDISNALEKLARKNEKIKESLSTRRKDRINPNEFKGFSIVDLAVAFDNDKKIKLKEKYDKLKIEEDAIIESRKDYKGNKEDSYVKDRETAEDVC